MTDRDKPSIAQLVKGIYSSHDYSAPRYFGPERPRLNHVQTVVPNRVFKFVKREYMNGALSAGTIRLGTLYDFRKTEEHGKNRGDPKEGRNNVTQHVAFRDTHDPDSFVGRHVVLLDGARMENCTIIEERNSPDSYVFCTSTVFSEEIFRKWNMEDGVDACYEIFDLAGFTDAVSNAVGKSGQLVGHARVAYVNGDLDGEAGQHRVHPAFVKDEDPYEWQTEYRFVWHHKKPKEAKPKVYKVDNLSKFCRRIAVLQDGEVLYLNKISQKE